MLNTSPRGNYTEGLQIYTQFKEICWDYFRFFLKIYIDEQDM